MTQELQSADQALPVDAENSEYIVAATSDNTRKAYQADIEHFISHAGPLPTQPHIVERYLRDFADQLNPRTLVRRVTALRQWHKLKGIDDPTRHPLVMKTLKGIRRLHGQPKRQALALRLRDLEKIAEQLKEQGSLMDLRNRALLLVGFYGAFRRSELVPLKWEQVQFVAEGMVIRVPRSKTDQVGEGANCIIPFTKDNRCPVRALLEWRQAAKLWDGMIFRRFSKVGNILDEAISPHYVNQLVQRLVKAAGIPNAEQYSAHSLRRGFATEAARLGASMPAIQRHGRWKSTRTVVEYIEAGRQFADSALNVMFE